MKNFTLLDQHIDVREVAAQLDDQPGIWNVHPERKTAEGTPHAAMSDIWVRFRPRHELTEPVKFIEPHLAEFYPAWRALPSLQPIVWRLVSRFCPVQLGGILITKIPPGGRILPHHDRGGWHAEHYNLKLYLPIRSNPQCFNHCEGETVSMQSGELWSFDNLRVHSVENNGATDRITAILCMRIDR